MEEIIEHPMETAENYTNLIIDLIQEYGLPLLLAIITLIVGLRVIKWVTKVTRKTMDKRGVDETLAPFLTNLVNWTLKVMLIISVIDMIGVETTSLVAVLGAAGLAVGLALQGTLANFAGGVLILIQRPFKVGDFIDTSGYQGSVQSIQLFYTVLLTPQNRRVIIPNGQVSNNSLMNYSAEDKVRMDLTVGIGYSSDIDTAKAVLHKIVDNHPKVLKDPAVLIAVEALADSSVNIALRPWVKTAEYWDLFFDLQQQIKVDLDAAGIEIPFPQRDIHLHKADD